MLKKKEKKERLEHTAHSVALVYHPKAEQKKSDYEAKIADK